MAENWPQWRGPGSNGVSTEAGLPQEWSATKNLLWKAELPGRGHSSPVVWGNRIFLTTSVEGDVIPGAKAPKHILEGEEFRHPDAMSGDRSHALYVLGLDAATGKILWQQKAYEGRVFDDRHKKNTYATPTPVTDGKRVFVSFESQGVYAYSVDGKPLWKAAAGNVATVGMGPASSPVLAGEVLVCQFDQEEGQGSFLVAFSTRNGKVLWRKPRNQPAGWSTPILVKDGKREMVVASGMKDTIAYDPKTGAEAWRAPGVEGNSVPSSVSGLGMIFPSAGYPNKRVFGLDLQGKVLWRYEKGTAYVPSPILYGDYLYIPTDRGLLTCLEARTGKLVYEGKRVPKPATFSASPVAFEGKIFLTSEDGETFVIKAGPEYEVLATNTLDEPVHASPAIANGRVYVRGARHLFAFTSSTTATR